MDHIPCMDERSAFGLYPAEYLLPVPPPFCHHSLSQSQQRQKCYAYEPQPFSQDFSSPRFSDFGYISSCVSPSPMPPWNLTNVVPYEGSAGLTSYNLEPSALYDTSFHAALELHQPFENKIASPPSAKPLGLKQSSTAMLFLDEPLMEPTRTQLTDPGLYSFKPLRHEVNLRSLTGVPSTLRETDNNTPHDLDDIEQGVVSCDSTISRSFRLRDHAAIKDFVHKLLKDIQATPCKTMGQKYLAAIDPGKSKKFPYTIGSRKKPAPAYWPDDVRYGTPAHLIGEDPYKLLLHIVLMPMMSPTKYRHLGEKVLGQECDVCKDTHDRLYECLECMTNNGDFNLHDNATSREKPEEDLLGRHWSRVEAFKIILTLSKAIEKAAIGAIDADSDVIVPAIPRGLALPRAAGEKSKLVRDYGVSRSSLKRKCPASLGSEPVPCRRRQTNTESVSGTDTTQAMLVEPISYEWPSDPTKRTSKVVPGLPLINSGCCKPSDVAGCETVTLLNCGANPITSYDNINNNMDYNIHPYDIFAELNLP